MCCPLIQSISYQNPLQIFAQFADQHGAVFLDSAEQRQYCGRYSFIAIDPFMIFSSKNGVIQMNNETLIGDPFLLLQQQLNPFLCETYPHLPPFQGGKQELKNVYNGWNK